MQESDDILAAFDIESSVNQDKKESITIIETQEIGASIKKSLSPLRKIRNSTIFLVKYFTTSACIF
jgi:hypothetical protein